MQSISNIFKEYLRQRNREWLVKVDIAGEEYGSETIVDFTVETSVSTGEELEIGTANISKLTLRLKKTITVPPNARVVPYVALSLPEEYEGNAGVAWQDNEDTWETADYLWNGAVTEWLPMGEFFVDTRQIVQGHILELTCVDRMRFADIAYVSSLTYPTTMQAVWDEVCERAGFAYGDSVQINPSYQIEVGPAGYTCRQVLGYIAAAHGACVYVDRWGIVQWRKFSAVDNPVDTFTKADYARVKETGPVKTYTRIVVVYNPDDGLAFESGSGDEAHTLYIENPFATPQMVQNLYAQLNGFSYAPVDMDVRGYPQFDAGDRIRYGTPAEELTWNAADVAWQDADITWDGFEGSQPQGITLLMNVRYTFKGGLRMEFEAPARSEQQSEFRVEGYITQQINRLRATAVREGRSYYGLTVTRQRGLEIEREDHKSKITLNSDEMDWKVNGQSSLYFDAQAEKLKFRGDIEMLGGTISWSNVNAPDIDDIPNLSGRLTYIGPTGIYSGTIKTDQLIAGTAKISSALIDTIKANQIVVGDNGEKIGDGLIASAANWNGKTTLLTPTGIYTGTIEANQINAASLSAISANLGTVTAGVIQGVTILGGVISGPTITGATVTGGTIQTQSPGFYPRIELSETNNWLNFEASSTRYLRIYPGAGLFTLEMRYDGSIFSIGKGLGSAQLYANDNLYLSNGTCAIQMVGSTIQIHAPGGVFIDGRPI
jgi:hypothetical protein